MALFYLKFRLLENARSDCMTLFAGMSKEDDDKDMGEGIALIGRWSTLGEGAGFCVCRAKDAQTLGRWLSNWSTMATIEAIPIVDDNQARAIILGKPPDYTVDYGRAGETSADGDSLYFIEYRFHAGCKAEGYKTFADLSREDDLQDAGNNVCLGRWHDLGSGSGIAVCSSKSEVDLYTWAYRWMALCDVKITPVLHDDEFRAMMRQKPDFSRKHAALMERMLPKRAGFFWR